MRHFLTALFLTVATPLLAQPFYVGTWIYDGGLCSNDQSLNGGVRLTETEYWGLENHCFMSNPTNIRDLDGILFDLECTGEGETYSQRLLLLDEYNGNLTTHRSGFTSTYLRCEEI